jgi:predicted secreted Zn-dependent protease
MRIAQLTAVIAAFALAGVVAVPAAPTVAARPVLQILSLAPFSVRGTHFQPAERVKVTLNGVHVKRTRATANGAFVVTFRSVDVDRCNGYVVKAAGSKGSTVKVRAPELECASTNPG